MTSLLLWAVLIVVVHVALVALAVMACLGTPSCDVPRRIWVQWWSMVLAGPVAALGIAVFTAFQGLWLLTAVATIAFFTCPIVMLYMSGIARELRKR